MIGRMSWSAARGWPKRISQPSGTRPRTHRTVAVARAFGSRLLLRQWHAAQQSSGWPKILGRPARLKMGRPAWYAPPQPAKKKMGKKAGHTQKWRKNGNRPMGRGWLKKTRGCVEGPIYESLFFPVGPSSAGAAGAFLVLGREKRRRWLPSFFPHDFQKDRSTGAPPRRRRRLIHTQALFFPFFLVS